MPSGPLGWFRLVSFIEGLSYVALLFIAMPLKYLADMPLAVRITGSAHGFLWIAFVLLLLQVWSARDWSWKQVAVAFIVANLPFGAFWLERRIKVGELAGRPV